MSITKPFTFVAGTKARANEVNQNFDVLYSQVNSNISAINANANDIDTLDSNKANVNGSSSQRFAVANPVNNYDAVNKQSLSSVIGNSIDLISGLTITKDSNSPGDTIIVNTGSCYDSTKAIVLKLANATSKKNDSQGANATYYVYIIGNSTGSSIDILISSSQINPALPSGYSLYRYIGSYTTDENRNISNITFFGIPINSSVTTPNAVLNYIMPDWEKRVYRGTDYTLTEDCWVYLVTTVGWANTSSSSMVNDVCIGGGLGRGDSTMRVGGIWIGVVGDHISGSFGIYTVPFRGRSI